MAQSSNDKSLELKKVLFPDDDDDNSNNHIPNKNQNEFTVIHKNKTYATALKTNLEENIPLSEMKNNSKEKQIKKSVNNCDNRIKNNWVILRNLKKSFLFYHVKNEIESRNVGTVELVKIFKYTDFTSMGMAAVKMTTERDASRLVKNIKKNPAFVVNIIKYIQEEERQNYSFKKIYSKISVPEMCTVSAEQADFCPYFDEFLTFYYDRKPPHMGNHDDYRYKREE